MGSCSDWLFLFHVLAGPPPLYLPRENGSKVTFIHAEMAQRDFTANLGQVSEPVVEAVVKCDAQQMLKIYPPQKRSFF